MISIIIVATAIVTIDIVVITKKKGVFAHEFALYRRGGEDGGSLAGGVAIEVFI